MQVWTRAVLLDRTSMLPVKLRCRFAIRYLQYAVDCQVLVCRHPILQEKTTPRYSQLAITHRTHSPMLQKVSKNLNQKKNWSLDSPSTSILFCILFPHVHGIINLLIILHVINILLVFYSPEINDLWQTIITSSMGKQLMV